jgi:RNA polymerase sigma factor (sigma-70 family)
MATGLQQVLECLRHADGQLLARFVAARDEAAFAALVRRHGPMVLGVCRRVLRHEQDAEDAFQATFLVLARKAASVVKRESLGCWLYQVAYHTALQARAASARRRARETPMRDVPHPEVAPAEADDWRPLLDRELCRLPEKYRAAVILCDLEGQSRREAARQLGVPEGTVSSRLAAAHKRLARQLARYGLAPAGGVAAALSGGPAPARVPAALVWSTARAAALVAAGQLTAAPGPAVLLMREVIQTMFLTKLKLAAGVAVVVAALAAGGLTFQAVGQDRLQPQAERRPDAGGRPLTELELLRREVDILKLQMEVVQAELRSLKGKAGAGARPAWGTRPDMFSQPPSGGRPAPDDRPQAGPGGPKLRDVRPDKGPGPAGADQLAPSPPEKYGPGRPSLDRLRSAPDPLQEAEAALKKLRQQPDDQQAADALEKAVKRLKEWAKPDGGAKNYFGR